MELKDFIKTAISSIANGIIEAQAELKEKNVIINPEKLETGKSGEKILRHDGWRYTQDLEFEVLVTVDEKSADSIGGKLQILSFASMGGGTETETNINNSNKLKFKIPVAFPTTETPEKYKPKELKAPRISTIGSNR